MAKNATGKNVRKNAKHEGDRPHVGHSSDMVTAQKRAAEEYRADTAKKTSFRQHPDEHNPGGG